MKQRILAEITTIDALQTEIDTRWKLVGVLCANMRKTAGYSVRHAAHMAHIDHAHLHRFENGEKLMSAESLRRLAMTLERALASTTYNADRAREVLLYPHDGPVTSFVLISRAMELAHRGVDADVVANVLAECLTRAEPAPDPSVNSADGLQTEITEPAGIEDVSEALHGTPLAIFHTADTETTNAPG